MKEKNKLLLLMLQRFLDHSQDMIFVKDLNQKYVAASRPFLQRVNCCKEQIAGKTDYDFFEEKVAQEYIADDQAVLKSGVDTEEHIEPTPEQYGENRHTSISKYIIKDESGVAVGIYGMVRDATAEVFLEETKESKRIASQMFDIVIEADLTEDKMAPADGEGWIQELGITNQNSYTETLIRIADAFMHPSYKNNFLALYSKEKLEADYEEGNTEFQYVAYTNFTKEGFRWTEFRTRVYYSRWSASLRVTIFLKDVDQDVRYREQLQRKSMTDALTGLNNKSYMVERITDYISEEMRNDEDVCALLFIDLDNFKKVNDRWGHKYGDKMLQKAAKRLQNLLHEKAICGRLGGDEFLVFLKGMVSADKVKEKAEELLDALMFKYEEEGEEIEVTCSIGIALCNSNDFPTDLLMQNADRAMRYAKEQGKNQIYFYDEK